MFSTKTPWLTLAVSVLAPLALAVPAARGEAAPAESKRVVAVIAMDSLDKNIGKSVAKDGERVKQTLEDGFSKNKDQLVLHPTIDGDKITPDGILEIIDKLAIEKTDTLLFYYSGHGAWDKDKGQYLQMYSGAKSTKGDLFRATLVAKLKGKNARLTVLLTDICNIEAPSRAPLTRDLTIPPNYAALRCLLLLPEGLVDITSSEKGQLSWSWFPDEDGKEMGGLFTVPLVDLFRAKLKPDEILTWKVAHRWLQEWTQNDYAKYREIWLEAYNKLPDEKRTAGLKESAKLLREQTKQTVHAYSLPTR